MQVWDKLNDIESGQINADGDLMISESDSVHLSDHNPAFHLRALMGSNQKKGRNQPNETTHNYTISYESNDGNNATARAVTGRWFRMSTSNIHGIAICGLLAVISTTCATVNAVFIIKCVEFSCIQQGWLCFGAFFQFVTMCMIWQNSDSMYIICPYRSYTIMGWLSSFFSMISLFTYGCMSPFACCLKIRRRPCQPTT